MGTDKNRLMGRGAFVVACVLLLTSALQAAVTPVDGDGWGHFGLSWGDDVGISYSFVPSGVSYDWNSYSGTTTSLSTGGFSSVDVSGETAKAFKSWQSIINAIPGQSINFTNVADSGVAWKSDTEAEALAGSVGIIRILAADLSGGTHGTNPGGFGLHEWGPGPSYVSEGGDIFLNSAATWDNDSLYQVMVHEICHSVYFTGLGVPEDSQVLDCDREGGDIDFLAAQGQLSSYRGGADGSGIFMPKDIDGINALFAPGALPTVLPPGGGFGAGGTTPEPASVTILTMMLIGGACWRRRKQREDVA